jgi:hypothetical protein
MVIVHSQVAPVLREGYSVTQIERKVGWKISLMSSYQYDKQSRQLMAITVSRVLPNHLLTNHASDWRGRLNEPSSKSLWIIQSPAILSLRLPTHSWAGAPALLNAHTVPGGPCGVSGSITSKIARSNLSTSRTLSLWCSRKQRSAEGKMTAGL